MKRLFARLATVVAAVPLVLGSVTGSAQAGDTTIRGCYGVGVVVCDLTITINAPIGVESYQTYIPVCAGTCTTVPVTFVRTTPGEPTQLCYRYSDFYGNVSSYCATGGGNPLDDIVDIEDVPVEELVDYARGTVYELREQIKDADACEIAVGVLNALGFDVQCA